MQGFYLNMHPQNSLQRKGNDTRHRTSTLLQFILSTVVKKKGRKEKRIPREEWMEGGRRRMQDQTKHGQKLPQGTNLVRPDLYPRRLILDMSDSRADRQQESVWAGQKVARFKAKTLAIITSEALLALRLVRVWVLIGRLRRQVMVLRSDATAAMTKFGRVETCDLVRLNSPAATILLHRPSRLHFTFPQSCPFGFSLTFPLARAC
ncbi:hypothetical protein K456DRAFT_351412 [Colletotrichum gloeosporioides 23]|nr:hypothetical protein K456DRAFT_351412 [Colletotrichum gloeosporioides 23]